MRKFAVSVALVALLAGVAGVSTPVRAETGQVAVVFTKGGFIVGIGGGEGVLVLRGKRYPFAVSGMSGNVKQPQVHFEVRKDASPVNPMTFLE